MLGIDLAGHFIRYEIILGSNEYEREGSIALDTGDLVVDDVEVIEGDQRRDRVNKEVALKVSDTSVGHWFEAVRSWCIEDVKCPRDAIYDEDLAERVFVVCLDIVLDETL